MESKQPDASGKPSKARVYPASEAAKNLFAHLLPFRAARDLGVVSEAELTSFGLAKPSGTLQLGLGDDKHIIDVGSTTFGAGSTYVRAANKHIYLVKSSLFGDFKNAGSALCERALVLASRDKIERVIIRSGTKSREVVQHFAEDRAKAFFADPAEPETRLSQTTNWLDRLMRTRMVDFATDIPTAAPALSVEWFDDRISLGQVRLWILSDANAVAVASGFDAPVTIPKATAENLQKDVETVLNESR